MGPDFFDKVRAAAAESVFLKPKPQLAPLRIGWELQGGTLVVLWPDKSPWIRYTPEGPVTDGMVARTACEAVRRMWLTLGPEPTGALLYWLLEASRSTGPEGAAVLPVFTLAEALSCDPESGELTFNPQPDFSIDLQILPPPGKVPTSLPRGSKGGTR